MKVLTTARGQVGVAAVAVVLLVLAVAVSARMRGSSDGPGLTNALAAGTDPNVTSPRSAGALPTLSAASSQPLPKGLYEYAGGPTNFVVGIQQRVGLCGLASGSGFGYRLTASSRYLYLDPEPGLANIIMVLESEAQKWLDINATSPPVTVLAPLRDLSASGPYLEVVNRDVKGRALKAARLCLIIDNTGPLGGLDHATAVNEPLLGKKVMRIALSLTWS